MPVQPFRKVDPDQNRPPPQMADPTATSQISSPPTAAPFSFYGFIPPPWLLGLLLSWLAFGTFLAIGLLMAQFPDAFNGWAWYTGRAGPDKKDDEDGRARRENEMLRKGMGNGMSSAILVRAGKSEGGGGNGAGGAFRLRKPRGLSVDTGFKGHGLGIEMPGQEVQEVGIGEKSVSERKSGEPPPTDRTDSYARSKQPLTAPLPSTRLFSTHPSSITTTGICSSGSESEAPQHTDIETGHHPPLRLLDLSDQYYNDNKPSTPYFPARDAASALARADAEEAENVGWLSFVNKGVYVVADKLADVLYDKVVSAEEGLVLPVREEEREGWRGRNPE